jgi:hypothetical protein
LLANIGDAGASRIIEFQGGRVCEIGAVATVPRIGATLEVRLAVEGAIRATPLSRMEILRSLGPRGYARVTFGTAAFRSKDREGHGLYEFARLVSCG